MSHRSVILVPPETPGDPASVDGSGSECAPWHIGHVVRGVATWTAVSVGEHAANSIVAALRQLGHGGHSVIMGLPSSWCLSATIATTAIPRGDHKALLYRLEERLPFAAEAVVADFVSSVREPLALGVCVRHSRVRPWIESLEFAGVTIKSIVPLALLIAGGVTEPRATGPQMLRVLVCSSGITPGIDLIGFHGLTPVAWAFVAGGAATDIARRRDWMSVQLGADSSLELVGIDSKGHGPATVHSLTAASAALDGAALLEHQLTGGIDLRRDTLAPKDRLRSYRGGLRAVAAAALVFMSAVAVAAFARESRYSQSAADADAQAVAEVRAAFPASLGNAPVSEIHAALAQERRSWANTLRSNDGVNAGEDQSPGARVFAWRSALRTIRDVVQVLPADADIRIDRSMFDETSFELSGRAKSYEDLDKLASAVRAVHPEVSLPASARGSDGTWTFTLKGATAATTTTR